MSRTLSSAPVVRVKPQPNIYTLLLVIAIVVLGVALGLAVWDLTEHYALTFKQLFIGQEIPPI